MTLINLIKSSYGIEDRIFAGHELDRERALKALKVAQDEKVGYTEFIEMHRQFLQNENCSEEHINEQLERVNDLELYFKLD
jgi:hypothetical protein